MRLRYLTASVVVAALLGAPAAHASFPGANGRIAYGGPQARGCLYSINPDGTGKQLATPCQNQGDGHPAWSPEGRRLAYINPNVVSLSYVTDGANPQVVFDDFSTDRPRWSPDGEHLVSNWQQCSADLGPCNEEVFTIKADRTEYRTVVSAGGLSSFTDNSWSSNGTWITYTNLGDNVLRKVHPDGTGAVAIATDAHDPDWSPDSRKIAFSRSGDIWVMNADGTGQVRLTNNPAHRDFTPAWSPDGTKIAFGTERDEPNPGSCYPNAPTALNCNDEIYVMNADGSGQTNITNTPGDAETAPDWQPVLVSYPRPKGATPFKTYLVVAYKPCTAPNRTHGSPLAFPSCTPPQQSSDWLTIGTADSNGQPTTSVDSVRYDVIPGNPATPADEADVGVTLAFRDIRNKSDLSDYTGELLVDSILRITDKFNSGTDPGTMQDIPFHVSLGCAATADTTTGSTCNLTTSADATVPGFVPEGRRSVWQMGPVQVFDGGSDGSVGTGPAGTLFMDEGVFVP